jgi:hypothetical protein
MTQEEKKLLLIDLCAREPYHPRIQVFNQGYEGFQDGEFDTNLWLHHIDAFRFDRIEILPYLRPMGSMTEEEKDEFDKLMNLVEERCINAYGKGGYTLSFTELNDWLNKNKFDYRGLIRMGLAIAAKERMYGKI